MSDKDSLLIFPMQPPAPRTTLAALSMALHHRAREIAWGVQENVGKDFVIRSALGFFCGLSCNGGAQLKSPR